MDKDVLLDNWKRIGASDTVLTWISEGVPVSLKQRPEKFHLPNHSFNFSESLFVCKEIDRLLRAGYIKQCDKKPDYISPIGCVSKKTGGYRLITDFRRINECCETSKFKQEDIRNVSKVIKDKDYLTSIDLKDGFYNISIKKEDQGILSFEYQGKFYSYVALPFGYCLSPYYFAKILRPVVCYLRQFGIRLSLYVDDFLVCAALANITDHTDQLVHTLTDLGIKINFEKSVLTPSQSIEYLGYTINTSGRHPVIKAEKKKIVRLKKQIKTLLKKGKASARVIAKTTGLCISVAWVVTPGKLFLRHLFRLLASRSHWNDVLYLNSLCRNELNWWLEKVDEFNYKEIKPEIIEEQLITDASSFAWGAKLGDLEAKGDWNQRVSGQSSNYRELLAILLALSAFKDKLEGKCIQILTDNVTAAAYINHKGGPSVELTEIAVSIWAIATEYSISMTSKHIAGVSNQEADRLSRSPDRHNWQLNRGLFMILNQLWGQFTVDRFATLQNTLLPRFNSRYYEPMSEGIDALAQDWSGENNYINPPWALLPQVVTKIRADKALATVIAPVWPGQVWYQKLVNMLVEPPILLPQSQNIFIPMGVSNIEPWKNRGWKIAAWRVCGDIG